MNHVMAVYDVDLVYAKRLAEVVNQRESVPFELMAFSSLESLKTYRSKHPIELLLISQSVSKEAVEELDISQVITLADGEAAQAEQEYPSIYKYQSSETIIREVMACYCENEEPSAFVKPAASRTTVIGVYSPIGRCLKTSFAITMGQLLSKDSRVLYLTFENYSGLSALTGTEYSSGLSDLMYFYKQGNYNVLRLNSMVHSMGGLDYIPPARFPEDVQDMGSRELAGLIRRILEDSMYEILILDIGNYERQILPLLELCSVVYMPVKEDGVSAAKIEEFEHYLEEADHTGISEKIKRLKLPYHNSFGKKENYLEQLLWGELGDYVRQILKGKIRYEGI